MLSVTLSLGARASFFFLGGGPKNSALLIYFHTIFSESDIDEANYLNEILFYLKLGKSVLFKPIINVFENLECFLDLLKIYLMTGIKRWVKVTVFDF